MIEEIKQQLIDEHRLGEVENRLKILEDKFDNLLSSLKLEFYNSNQSEYKDD